MSDRESALEAELKAVRTENRLLREKIDALIRLVYGQKSERFDPGQLTLEGLETKKADAPAADDEPAAGARKKAPPRSPKARGPRLPEHLPVTEEVLDPEEVKSDPQGWRQIGEEVTEQLDYEPARFLKRRLIRRKYVRLDHPYAPPVIAPLPACLQERCLATAGLIAQVVVSKYADHLPLYRQEQIYQRRYEVTIPRQTLCRWVALAASWLEPLYEEMKRRQEQSDYLQVDETPIRYLSPGTGKAPKGYLWVSNDPQGDVIYHFHRGRGAKCLHKIIQPAFGGTVQCDGYKAYPSFQKQRAGPLELVACWAHVRRKFYEAKARDPAAVEWILRQIGALYRIERDLREGQAGPALRAAVRSSQSAVIVQRLKRALWLIKPRYLPQSALGKAFEYAFEQWPRLVGFLEDGRLEIDNNLVENAIRPTKLGAKNWLFLGAEDAGPTSAILFTFVESAKRHGLEPYAYLKHLLETLPHTTNRQLQKLLPAAVAQSGKSSAA